MISTNFMFLSDKMFPALGFGGRLPNGIVSHDFNLVMIHLIVITKNDDITSKINLCQSSLTF